MADIVVADGGFYLSLTTPKPWNSSHADRDLEYEERGGGSFQFAFKMSPYRVQARSYTGLGIRIILNAISNQYDSTASRAKWSVQTRVRLLLGFLP
jgi:hypothetical protein